LEFQKDRIARNPKGRENLGKGGSRDLRVLVILDDIIGSDDAVHQDKVMNMLFALGRWLQTCVIISVQHMNVLGPLLRGNSDCAVFFRNSSKIVFDLVRENFMGTLRIGEVAQIMGKYTKDYRAFVVGAWNPEEKFYHFKAHEDLPTFRMARRFWKDKEQSFTDQPQGTLFQELRRYLKGVLTGRASEGAVAGGTGAAAVGAMMWGTMAVIGALGLKAIYAPESTWWEVHTDTEAMAHGADVYDEQQTVVGMDENESREYAYPEEPLAPTLDQMAWALVGSGAERRSRPVPGG
jgi:hypothetical protein